ncbi:MAG: hypothetical protein R3Y47_04990 [Lachnospiraceae bacterium]
MQSRIEELIDEIHYYIEDCKPSPFSRDNIIVNKDHMEELLETLRTKTPEEIKRYQKFMAQKEAILDDARAKADALVKKATIQTNELVSEHEIMQQAHARAQEIEMLAKQKAQEIVNAAAIEADGMKEAAVQYTDELLKHIETLMAHAIQTTSGQYDNMLNSLNSYYTTVQHNRVELRPAESVEAISTNTTELNLDLFSENK